MPEPNLTELPQPLQAVLFDMDGTLVDSEALHFQSTNVVLRPHGAHLILEDFTPFIGMAETPFWQHLRQRFRLPTPAEDLVHARTSCLLEILAATPIVPMPGVLNFLRFLRHRNIPCAVASSSTRPLMEATLAAAGLRQFFRSLCSGHGDVKRGKPHPDVYLLAAQQLQVSVQHCLAVEDSQPGVQAAKSAGAYVAAIPCPSHPDPNLHEAHLRMQQMTDLHTALQKLWEPEP